MCTCLCAVNFLQWRLNAGCIFCFKVNFIAPLPVRHPWQPWAPSSLSFRLPFSFKTSATCQRAKFYFFWQFLFLYREREEALPLFPFHLNFTWIGCNVFLLEALQCICFALIMCLEKCIWFVVYFAALLWLSLTSARCYYSSSSSLVYGILLFYAFALTCTCCSLSMFILLFIAWWLGDTCIFSTCASFY